MGAPFDGPIWASAAVFIFNIGFATSRFLLVIDPLFAVAAAIGYAPDE